MNPLVEFIKEFLIPGSTWFLLIAATASVVLFFGSERKRRLARGILVGLVVFYWVISVPVIAHGLQSAQRKRGSEPASRLPDSPLPIVVLGNGLGGYVAFGGRVEVPDGRTAMNTLFALDRYRAHPASMVIASGGVQPPTDTDGYPEGAVIRDALVRNHVPSDHIIVEGRSTTTREQALATTAILKQLGATTCIVVTSAQQMDRAVDLFAHEGIKALPLYVTTVAWSLGDNARWWEWLLPSTSARAVSRDVIYELIAWPYYRVRGWVG